MKIRIISLVLFFLTLPVFSQVEQTQIAPGAESQLEELFNNPASAAPVSVTHLRRSWFRVELDTHVFTDADFRQIVAVLLDVEGHGRNFNGKKFKLRASVVSQGSDEIIADFTSTSIAALGLQFTTNYRSAIRVLENTDTRFVYEIRQLPQNSETNDKIRNFDIIRYAEEVTINGKKYTYIRASSVNNVNAHLNLPNIRNTVERSSDVANKETLEMLIEAARAN
jgi:hypothetical protein